MTTESSAPSSQRRWAVPVRVRFTVAVVVLSGLALAGAGLVVYLLESRAVDEQTNRSIEQEVAEFEALARRGDPATEGTGAESREPFRNYRDLFSSTLSRNVPSEGEFIFAYWDDCTDCPLYLTSDDRYREVVQDEDFRAEVAALREGGGSGTFEDELGTYRYAVKVAQSARDRGVVVFAYDMAVQRADLNQLMRTYAAVASIAVLVVAVSSAFIAGRLLQPLRELRRATQEISAGDLSRRLEVTGNDDLTRLTQTFNAMLDRLEGSFATQRRFLDDVGHELRTPITITQGHLELLDARDPTDVEGTRELVLDEMSRMSRLVEELILLAKTRRPDFLTPEVVDAADLTTGLFDKMRGLDDRDWRIDEVAQVTAVLDQQRITQAVLQLASNAVRHTDEDSVIAVGSAGDDEQLRFWVRDTGDGIDPAEQARIFERFRRATAAGEGSGLGLTIVREIARAHGGDVSVVSALGEGATFTITIPREQPWSTGS